MGVGCCSWHRSHLRSASFESVFSCCRTLSFWVYKKDAVAVGSVVNEKSVLAINYARNRNHLHRHNIRTGRD